MTVLFDRKITVTVGTLKFESLDCAFNVQKSLKPEPNTCELSIWNLNPDHRAQLEEIRPKSKRATVGIPCLIDAGYQDGTTQIWLGDLRNGESEYKKPDWITKLTSGDGEKAWQNARLHVTYGPKTGIDTALRAMARALGVGEGNLSKTVAKLKIAGSGIFPTGWAHSGPVSSALVSFARSADLEISIQDGALQILDRGKALAGQAVRLAPETGMIESPTVDNDGIVTVKTLLIPDIRVGGLVTIDAKRVKGAYRVLQAEWAGDTAGDEWGITIKAKRY